MEKLFQRWYDLISIDSVSGHEVGAADYVAEVLRSMGLEPHSAISRKIPTDSVLLFGQYSIAASPAKPCFLSATLTLLT